MGKRGTNHTSVISSETKLGLLHTFDAKIARIVRFLISHHAHNLFSPVLKTWAHFFVFPRSILNFASKINMIEDS